MISKCSVLLILSFSFQAAYAQYDISVKVDPPLPNRLDWYDCWNVEIVNNISVSSMQAAVTLHITMAEVGGETVVEGETEIFIVPPGATVMNYAIAKTKSIRVINENSSFKTFYRNYKELPDGSYSLCAEITLFDPSLNILYTTSDCIIHLVEHPGIIILNTPFNGDTVSSSNLHFTWTHANQTVQILQPYYLFELAPINERQSPETAISANQKRLSVESISEPYYNYPQIERELDTIQRYAWKVTAYTDAATTTTKSTGESVITKKDFLRRQVLATSEAGFFICAEPAINTGKKSDSGEGAIACYIDLTQWKNPSQVYRFKNEVPLSLNNIYGTRNLNFKLYNDRHQLLSTAIPPRRVDKGYNKFKLDLTRYNLLPGSYYYLQLILGEKENDNFKILLLKI